MQKNIVYCTQGVEEKRSRAVRPALSVRVTKMSLGMLDQWNVDQVISYLVKLQHKSNIHVRRKLIIIEINEERKYYTLIRIYYLPLVWPQTTLPCTILYI